MPPLTLLLPLIFLFLLGTAVGSFLNVVSRRLLRGVPVTGRSHCESCGKTLSGADLILLLSFFLLRGRCRYCGARLSWQYPLVEVGTGLLFAVLYSVSSQEPVASSSLITYHLSLITLLIASSSLIVIFITDLLKQRVFDQVVLVGIAAALVYRVLLQLNPTGLGFQPVGLLSDLGLASAAFLFFWALRLITRGRGMGEGDPPTGFLVTLLVGFPQGLVALFLAFLFGAVVGLTLILLKKKKLGDQIPFGPFLASAVFVTILVGDYLWSWYIGILGF